ncbi:MAG: cupin domain-containing protein [Elainellaceae cyanobacterium]
MSIFWRGASTDILIANHIVEVSTDEFSTVQEVMMMTRFTVSTHEESDFSMSIPARTSPETIVNPVTGDRMTIMHTAQQSQGVYAKIRFELPPGAKGSPLHYHTGMDETFTVLEGCLDMEVEQKGKWHRLQAGEGIRVPAGMYHSFCNRSEDWVTFTTENLPATGFEQFIQGMYGLAIDSKVNSDGIPTNLLQFVILVKRSDTIPAGIPPFLFGLIIGVLAWVAQVFNVERSLHKYWQNDLKGAHEASIPND